MSDLSDREFEIMQALWQGGPLTARQVQQALPGRPDNSTVRTFLRILERKGHITHRKRGRAFVYSARTSRDRVARQAVDLLVDRFFDGSRSALLAWAGRPRRRARRTVPAARPPVEETRREEGIGDDVWLL